ncbi:MAG: hypothetical protein K0Q79_2600 [Flavipsychrobacter sp.]|jgi:hypothetical protein|nr:hypothetical protein [Flavipsychrobacter sp.]
MQCNTVEIPIISKTLLKGTIFYPKKSSLYCVKFTRIFKLKKFNFLDGTETVPSRFFGFLKAAMVAGLSFENLFF